MSRRFTNLLVVVSGCAGLIYELLWFRVLDLRFGVSSHAVATTLAVFMLGLGLGGAWFGRRADRTADPWHLFWRLEVCTAATTLLAFGVAWWNPAADRIFALTSLYPSPLWQWSTRVLLAAVLILPATACMGGIVPVLARACTASRAQIGTRYGALYACNTLGAVVGAVLGGFVLVRVLGVTGSVMVAVGLNLVVAVLAMISGSTQSRPPSDTCRETSVEGETSSFAKATAGKPSSRSISLCGGGPIVFLGGFTLIGYEVLWSRIMINQGASTSYALTALLVAVLLGLMCGGALASVTADHMQRPRIWLGVLFALAVVVLARGMLTLMQTGALRAMVDILSPHLGNGVLRIILQETLGGSLVIFMMAVLWGWLFPLAIRAFVSDLDVLGAGAGRLQGINAVGMACGSLATGFLFLPHLGMKGAHGVLLVATGLAGLLVLLPFLAGRRSQIRNGSRDARPPSDLFPDSWRASVHASRSVLARIVTTVLLFAVGAFTVMLYRQTPAHCFRQFPDETLYYYGEGVGATVTVLGRTIDGHVYKNLLVDSHSVSGDYPGLLLDCKLLAHVPLMLAAAPGRAATVGFGTGGTSYSMRLYGAAVSAIEIEPCVIKASREFLGVNGGVLRDPGFNLIMDDARHHFAGAVDPYDVIVTDVTSPKYKRNVYLYTSDYFARMRARLAPGGVAAAWLPFSGLSDADVRMVVATFDSVFPHTTLWAMMRDRAAFLLIIGTLDPLRVDFAAWNSRFAATRTDLAVIGIKSPAELAGLLRMGEADVDRYTRGAPLNTDNRPRLEFSDLDDYLRVSHWPVYQAMMRSQQEDLTAYATGSPTEIELMRVALAAARAEADSWGARHPEAASAK